MTSKKVCSPCLSKSTPSRINATIVRVQGSNDPNHPGVFFIPDLPFSKCKTIYITSDNVSWRWDGEKFVKSDSAPTTFVESTQESAFCNDEQFFPNLVMNVENGNDPNDSSVVFDYDECKHSKNLKFQTKDGSLWSWDGNRYVKVTESDCPDLGVFNGLDPNLLTRSRLSEEATLSEQTASSTDSSSSSTGPTQQQQSLFSPDKCQKTTKTIWEADDESRWQWNPLLGKYEKIKEGVVCDVHHIRGSFNPNRKGAILTPAICKKDPNCIWLSGSKVQWVWYPPYNMYIRNSDIGCLFIPVDAPGSNVDPFSNYSFDPSELTNFQPPRNCLNPNIAGRTFSNDDRFQYVVKTASGKLLLANYNKQQNKYTRNAVVDMSAYPDLTDPDTLKEFCQSVDIGYAEDENGDVIEGSVTDLCYGVPGVVMRDNAIIRPTFLKYDQQSDAYVRYLKCPLEVSYGDCDIPYSMDCTTLEPSEQCWLANNQIYRLSRTGKTFVYSSVLGRFFDKDIATDVDEYCNRIRPQIDVNENDGTALFDTPFCKYVPDIIYKDRSTGYLYESKNDKMQLIEVPWEFYKDPKECFDPFNKSCPVYPRPLAKFIESLNLPYVFYFNDKPYMNYYTHIEPHENHNDSCLTLPFFAILQPMAPGEQAYLWAVPMECFEYALKERRVSVIVQSDESQFRVSMDDQGLSQWEFIGKTQVRNTEYTDFLLSE